GPATATPSKLDLIAIVAPYVFVAGLLVLVAAAGELAIGWVARVGDGWPWYAALVFVPVGISLLFGWRVDVNEFSMHSFYRDRLARCYLGASNRNRHPSMFTGFDVNDFKFGVAELKLSFGYGGPFSVFCSAMNLIVGDELAW